MAITYEPIATTTLTSGNSTITFSSIPSTYTDLKLVFVTTVTASTGNVNITFNSDSATNYSRTYLNGNGTATATLSLTSAAFIQLTPLTGLSTTVPTFYTLDIFNYAGSTFKTALGTQSADLNGSGSTANIVGMWRSTTAINTIAINTGNAQTFAVGTTATLYGIKAA